MLRPLLLLLLTLAVAASASSASSAGEAAPAAAAGPVCQQLRQRAKAAPLAARLLAHEDFSRQLWPVSILRRDANISDDRPINVTATAEALSSGCWRGVSARRQYLVLGRATRPQHVEADALVDWTPEAEQIVWAALGWQPWSEWSACSASCGGGVQRRRRACSLSAGCQGHDAELRRCNTFSCVGSVDALSLEDRRYFHPARAQWQRVPGRPSAYRLRPNSYIWVPSAQLFPRTGGFPAEFSLLATLRLHPQGRSQGTVLSLRSRRQQDAYLSLEVAGDGQGMRLVHAANNGSTQLVALPGLKVQDGRWHHVAIGLHGDHTVRSYLDCRWVSTNILRRNSLDTPQDADVVIGYLFMGDLEQLTVVPSAEAVSEQCDADVALANDTSPVAAEEYSDAGDDDDDDEDDDDVDIDSSSEEGSGGGTEEDISDADNDIDTDYQYEVEWSEWSECSASCGTGAQSRFSRCVDDGKRLELCVEAGGERTETRACSRQPCPTRPPAPARARQRLQATQQQAKERKEGHGRTSCGCLNGGRCRGGGGGGGDGSGGRRPCKCPPGFSGRRCEQPVCRPACLHGGVCHSPGFCRCPRGFRGDRCQHAWCPAGCGPGRCVPPGRCECPAGRAGPHCWDLRCGAGAAAVVCRNGARCADDGSCACADGWTGKGCATPVCEPGCQHGGTCIKPHTCHCPPATSGDHCQHFWCRDACLNGGQCVGPDQCECPHNSSGATCATPVCDPPCENGATCQPGNTCLCDAVFTGTRCEKRKCEFRPLQEPYTRGFRRLVAAAAPADAASAPAAACDASRHGADCQQPPAQPRYQTLYKTFYRTVYRCADEARQ